MRLGKKDLKCGKRRCPPINRVSGKRHPRAMACSVRSEATESLGGVAAEGGTSDRQRRAKMPSLHDAWLVEDKGCARAVSAARRHPRREPASIRRSAIAALLRRGKVAKPNRRAAIADGHPQIHTSRVCCFEQSRRHQPRKEGRCGDTPPR